MDATVVSTSGRSLMLVKLVWYGASIQKTPVCWTLFLREHGNEIPLQSAMSVPILSSGRSLYQIRFKSCQILDRAR